jgi:3-deoxy-D-manno-octulosonic-acid transferase
MILRVFLMIWSALWTLGVPAILIYLARRGRKDPGYRAHLSERFGRYRDPLPGAVWVHAVSLGELRSAVPLIRALLDRGERVVTTHITPAGRREAETVFAADRAAGRLRAVWVPLETGWAYGGFFRAFRPAYGLVMEIEIWPRMVAASARAGVALFMCNAQYPALSLARDSRGLRLRQRVMRGFAGAMVKSDLQARRFASVGVRNIVVTGETRFDQPVPPHLVAAGRAARDWIGARERRVVTIASAIEGEDGVYIHAIRALQADHRARGLPAPLVVYVPRRPERFDEVAQTLSDEGFAVLRRSRLWSALDPATWGPALPVPEILLGDSLGEMYAYLAMADQVIVGGGFNPKGAHNISEALVLGRPVLTGPHIWTIEFPFAEARAAGVAISVPDAPALAAALVDGFDPDPEAIAAFVAGMRGGAARTLAALPTLLAKARENA